MLVTVTLVRVMSTYENGRGAPTIPIFKHLFSVSIFRGTILVPYLMSILYIIYCFVQWAIRYFVLSSKRLNVRNDAEDEDKEEEEEKQRNGIILISNCGLLIALALLCDIYLKANENLAPQNCAIKDDEASHIIWLIVTIYL